MTAGVDRASSGGLCEGNEDSGVGRGRVEDDIPVEG